MRIVGYSAGKDESLDNMLEKTNRWIKCWKIVKVTCAYSDKVNGDTITGLRANQE